MLLGAVCQIRNEIDIVGPLLQHLDALFDKVYLLDHKSVDRTTDILKHAVAQRPDWEYIYLDFDGHYQSQSSNKVMEKAFSNNVDFLFFLDADEFILVKDRQDLENKLSDRIPLDGVGIFHWCNCFPQHYELSRFHPDTKIWFPQWRSPYTKVVIPRRLYDGLDRNIWVSQGNHGVHNVKDELIPASDLGAMIHIPIRSRQQMQIKVIIKCLAYLAKENRNPSDGFHNFEMLSKIAEGELDDGALRRFIKLFDGASSIPAGGPMDDSFESEYTLISLRELAIPFSTQLELASPDSQQDPLPIIADALRSWNKTDPDDFDFCLENGTMRMVHKPVNKALSTQVSITEPVVEATTEILKPNQPIQEESSTIEGNSSPQPEETRQIQADAVNRSQSTGIERIFPSNIYRTIHTRLDTKIIQYSGLFDETWYLERYPDVALANMDPILHYLVFGAFEGRNPGLLFDSTRYLSENKDVADQGANPLLHYLKHGRREGRRIYPVVELSLPCDSSSQQAPDLDMAKWILPKAGTKEISDNGHQLSQSNPYPVASSGESSGSFASGKYIEIIICVHNALSDLRKCIRSVIPTLSETHQVIIVDDESDAQTRTYLDRLEKSYSSKIKVIRTPERYYYTKAANLGLREAKADITILLNSDTIVDKSWLQKLCQLAFLDPKIGIVGPLSNAAHYQSIPSIASTGDNSAINMLPNGVSIGAMNRFCKSWSEALDVPVVPIIHGFCFCIKREVIQKVGLFDERTFPKGYGEEADYSFRAMNAGYKLAIATDAYIFHAKSKSYPSSDRIHFMAETTQALKNKHPSRVEYSEEILKHHPILHCIRRQANILYQKTWVERYITKTLMG